MIIIDLPKRKSIRLKNYDYSSNGLYFITICSYNRECLFGTISNSEFHHLPNNPHLMIEKWILELPNKYPYIKIDKYIIMPNHIHLILVINHESNEVVNPTSGEHVGSPLHEMIKWFKTQTTNEYIRCVKNNLFPVFNKHIWQRNYYEHIIRTHDSYLEIYEYIHNNVFTWEKDKMYSI